MVKPVMRVSWQAPEPEEPEEQRLGPDLVKEMCEAAGFEETRAYNSSLPANKARAIYRRGHVKIEVTARGLTFKVQNCSKAWVWKKCTYISSEHYVRQDHIEEMLEAANKVPKPDFKKRKTAADISPIPFNEDRKFRYSKWGTEMQVEIHSAKVVDVVSIQEDRRLVSGLSPDKEAWFQLKCLNGNGATFGIITNGDVYYPITLYNKVIRITDTDDFKSKSSVYISSLGYFDKMVIIEAIKDYAGSKE